MELTNLVIPKEKDKIAVLDAVIQLPRNFVNHMDVQVHGFVNGSGEIHLVFKEDVETINPVPGKTGYLENKNGSLPKEEYSYFTYEGTRYMLFFNQQNS